MGRKNNNRKKNNNTNRQQQQQQQQQPAEPTTTGDEAALDASSTPSTTSAMEDAASTSHFRRISDAFLVGDVVASHSDDEGFVVDETIPEEAVHPLFEGAVVPELLVEQDDDVLMDTIEAEADEALLDVKEELEDVPETALPDEVSEKQDEQEDETETDVPVAMNEDGTVSLENEDGDSHQDQTNEREESVEDEDLIAMEESPSAGTADTTTVEAKAEEADSNPKEDDHDDQDATDNTDRNLRQEDISIADSHDGEEGQDTDATEQVDGDPSGRFVAPSIGAIAASLAAAGGVRASEDNGSDEESATGRDATEDSGSDKESVTERDATETETVDTNTRGMFMTDPIMARALQYTSDAEDNDDDSDDHDDEEEELDDENPDSSQDADVTETETSVEAVPDARLYDSIMLRALLEFGSGAFRTRDEQTDNTNDENQEVATDTEIPNNSMPDESALLLDDIARSMGIDESQMTEGNGDVSASYDVEAQQSRRHSYLGEENYPIDQPLVKKEKAPKKALAGSFCAGFGLASLFFLLLLLLLGIFERKGKHTEDDNPKLAPGKQHPWETEGSIARVVDLPRYTTDAIRNDRLSPQYNAFQWLKDDPDLEEYPDWKRIQRFALACLYFSTTNDDNEGWHNDDGWLEYKDECTWVFSSTSSLENITSTSACAEETRNGIEKGHFENLWLPNNGLRGSLPAEVFLVTSLKTIDLEMNTLTGSMPVEIGGLSRIEQIKVSLAV